MKLKIYVIAYKMIAKIFRTIMLLENIGEHLNEPFSKYLGQGIFEL